MLIIRIAQQLLSFLSIQLTLKFFGSGVYFLINEALLYFLLLLSLQQSTLNNIWGKKNILTNDLLSSMFWVMLLFGLYSIQHLEVTIIGMLISIFALSRMLERYAYITLLTQGKLLTGPLFVMMLIAIELLFVILGEGIIRSNELMQNFKAEQLRLMIVPVVFIVPSLYVIFRCGVSLKPDKLTKYYKRLYISNVSISLYFLAAVLLINIDRLFVGSSALRGFGSITYLFSLNIASALFGLLSIMIDKRKSMISNGYNIQNSSRDYYYLFLFFMISVIHWVALNKTDVIKEIFEIEIQSFLEIFSIYLIVGATFVFMLLSAKKILEGKGATSLYVLLIALVIKIGTALFFDSLLYANFMAAISLLLLSLTFLKNGILKQ